MKLIVVAPIYVSPEINYYHALMFHGYFPSRETDADPYGVHRNVFWIPDLCSPAGVGGEWAVTEALKDKFQQFRGATFTEVTFTRLIDVPWNVDEPVQLPAKALKDDELGGGLGREEFFAAFPLARPARRKVGRYYLFTPALAYVECKKRRYRGAKPVFFDFAEPAGEAISVAMASAEGHPLSLKMMEDFPVVYNDGYMFFTEEAFRVVEPHLDMRFFIKGELTLKR